MWVGLLLLLCHMSNCQDYNTQYYQTIPDGYPKFDGNDIMLIPYYFGNGNPSGSGFIPTFEDGLTPGSGIIITMVKDGLPSDSGYIITFVKDGLPPGSGSGFKKHPTIENHLPPVHSYEVYVYVIDSNPFIHEWIRNDTPLLKLHLCGYPSYYNTDGCRELNTTSDILKNCESVGGAVVFGIIVFLLSLMIFIGNTLVIIVILKRKDMRTHYNIIKASLAVADLLIGLILLGSVLPGMIYVRNSTEDQLVSAIVDNNSPQDIFFGAVLSLSLQASLLHLMFLSIDRFIAIKWPLRHRNQKFSILIVSLSLSWIISIMCSFVPAGFKNVFGFVFQTNLFIPMLTAKFQQDGTLGYHLPLYLLITFGIPFIITVVMSLLTGIIICRKLTARVKMLGSGTTSSRSRKSEVKQQLSVFVTLVAMIGAFSFTLVPAIVIQILFSVGILNCSNYSVSYTIACYIGLTNSLVNVLIYSIRDNKFKEAVAQIFKCK